MIEEDATCIIARLAVKPDRIADFTLLARSLVEHVRATYPGSDAGYYQGADAPGDVHFLARFGDAKSRADFQSGDFHRRIAQDMRDCMAERPDVLTGRPLP